MYLVPKLKNLRETSNDTKLCLLYRYLPPTTTQLASDSLKLDERGGLCKPQLVLQEDINKPSCSNAKQNFLLQRQNEFEETQNISNFNLNYHPYEDCCVEFNRSGSPKYGSTMSPNELYQFQAYPVNSEDYELNTSNAIVPAHKKLDRTNKNITAMNPMCNRQTGQIPIEAYQAKRSMLNTKVTVGMNKPKITIERPEEDENKNSGNQEANIFSRQAYRDRTAAAFRSQSVEDPSTLISSFFGNGGQSQTCFNTLLTCFKPFWDIIGTKGSENNRNHDWEIPFNSIKDLQWLGAGAQGSVFMGNVIVL